MQILSHRKKPFTLQLTPLTHHHVRTFLVQRVTGRAEINFKTQNNIANQQELIKFNKKTIKGPTKTKLKAFLFLSYFSSQ